MFHLLYMYIQTVNTSTSVHSVVTAPSHTQWHSADTPTSGSEPKKFQSNNSDAYNIVILFLILYHEL